MERNEINLWNLLDDYIFDNYLHKIVLMHDSDTSFFDDESIPKNPILYIFDTVEEVEEFFNSSEDYKKYKVNIVNDLCVLWVNGIKDNSLIYKNRG